VTSMYRTRQIGGAPPPGWNLPPGWGQPLDDPPLLRAAGSVGRWLWPTLSVTGFLVVTGFVFGHDDPDPGLSLRGLCTIALAAAVVILLTLRRTAGPGPLVRALFEYAVVFLLAVLVATTGVPLDAPAAPTTTQASTVGDQRPALVKTIDSFRDWLREWRAWARTQRDRGTRPEPKGAAMAAPPRIPTPPAPSIWRSHP
jgi:hypothetical protein